MCGLNDCIMIKADVFTHTAVIIICRLIIMMYYRPVHQNTTCNSQKCNVGYNYNLSYASIQTSDAVTKLYRVWNVY